MMISVTMQLFVLLCVMFGVQSSSVLNLDFGDDLQCGVEASPHLIHHNPWLVFLEYYHHQERKYIRCGGTLVRRRHVVTAAHCVNKDMFTSLVARLGEYDLSAESDCVGGVCADPIVRIDVIRISVPEGFDGREDDIAILELEHDAPYTDFIRPICLPTYLDRPENDVIYTAAGWGELTYSHVYSNLKKIIPLPAWSTKNCRNAYKKLSLPQKIICAGGVKGIDTCRGDSGGPLVLNKGVNALWGVTSSGSVHCGAKGSPGIYTSVVEHLGFINEVLSKARERRVR